MTSKIELQSLRLDSRYKKLQELSGKEFKRIKDFIDKSKNGEGSSGIDITDKTERKYIDAFVMTYKAVKKPISNLTKDDLIKLKQNLKSGKIKSKFKRAYTFASVRDMQTILIRFLEFVKPEKYSGFRKWFIINVPKKSVEYLKEEEVEKLYRNCKNNAERFLIAVLFDSGARASEFLNIRFEDIEKPTQSFPYYKIIFKEEYSKTKERNIGLYWKHSTEAIKDYLAELDDSNPKEPVFKKNYDAVRLFITRLGKKVLNKRVHFHTFRKSSASYYAVKLKSRQQLCYRYGWNFSSDIPDVYISREIGEEEVKDSIFNSDLQKIENENRELKTKISIIQDSSNEQSKELELMKQNQEFSKTMIEEIIDLMRTAEKMPKDQKNKVLQVFAESVAKSS
jgi:integrase